MGEGEREKKIFYDLGKGPRLWNIPARTGWEPDSRHQSVVEVQFWCGHTDFSVLDDNFIIIIIWMW